MEEYLYEGETEKIIAHALAKLGLDYLKTRAALPHRSVEHLKSRHLSASQWVQICDTLFMSANAISGYNYRSHKARIRFYWERGLLNLPSNQKVKSILAEIRRDMRDDRHFQKTCYSRGLRFRIFYRTLFPKMLRSAARHYNQALLQVQELQGMPCIEKYLVLQVFEPRTYALPTRTKKKKRESLILGQHARA